MRKHDTRKFNSLGPVYSSLHIIYNQALRYRIWDLGLGSQTRYKGKIWAFWTKPGLFWDHFGTFLGLFVVIFDDTTAKQYRRLKRHIVATFSEKSGLFENHFRTFTGNLDYILINIWRKCLIKYLKPNVFLIRAS